MPRPRVNLLSVDLIADAAIELADSGETFGVNALARRGLSTSEIGALFRITEKIISNLRSGQ